MKVQKVARQRLDSSIAAYFCLKASKREGWRGGNMKVMPENRPFGVMWPI